MRTLSPDTHPEAERVQIDLLRRATAAQRFARARSLSQTVIALGRRALQRAAPGLDEREVLLAFVATSYGEDLARRVRDRLGEGPG